MIWFSLIIPVLAIIILATKFAKKMNVLEYVLVFFVPVACIFVGKYVSIHSQTSDTEYWNSYISVAVYEEDWNEEVPCSHPKYETRTRTVTDSKGNTRTETYEVQVGYQHMYDVDYHPERWYKRDNIGNLFSTSRGDFENLCKLWNMRKFKDMNRYFHDNDGDAYVTQYDGEFGHTKPVCEIHTYENKVQCSKSVFNFEEISPETAKQYKLFEYPKQNKFNFNPILGYNSPEASKQLSIWNALNGRSKQIHMMLLVFKDQPLEAGLFQESYWKGGNKNEFILCVGLSGENKINWTKVISWTEQEELKIRTARQVKEMRKFDPLKVVKYMGENVPSKFVRKQFKDFSYLTVQPTTSAVIWTFVITVLLTIIISVISVINQCDFGTFIKSKRNNYRSRFIR